ncbi:UNVERIFIED_CONTAM: nucleoporin NDC1, partial [Bacteroidetes bacterium 56_B9]
RGVILHKSKDPNGSLLTGLKSKRETNKSFALWELYLITTQFESRRKTIYTEVDRAGGSTWSQVCNLCLAEISGVQQRIEEEIAPAEYKKKL